MLMFIATDLSNTWQKKKSFIKGGQKKRWSYSLQYNDLAWIGAFATFEIRPLATQVPMNPPNNIVAQHKMCQNVQKLTVTRNK